MNAFLEKKVLITGASSGIGADLARFLAGQGAHVAVLARRRERLDTLVADIRAAAPPSLASAHRRVVAAVADVTREDALQDAIATLRDQMGPFDFVVANAGYEEAGTLESLGLGKYREQFETNVFGVLRTIYATLGDLKETRGVLTIVGSVAGHMSAPGHSAYSMSKYALRALAEAIRREFRVHGVGVVLASPAFVSTDIRRTDAQGVVHAGRSDSVPSWACISAERTARAVARAMIMRRPEVVIGPLGKAAVLTSRFAPWLLQATLAKLTEITVTTRGSTGVS